MKKKRNENVMEETIKRNKDALHHAYDELSVNLFAEVNRKVSLQTIAENDFGYILADGLIVGYDLREII